MKEIIEKIGSYNLFNYLLPGVVFVGVIERTSTIELLDENLLITGFLCYFIGMIISRVGSILVEPILRKLKILTFVEYSQFYEASKKDEKIILLSEINNTYRTIVAMMLILLVLIPYDVLRNKYVYLKELDLWVLLIGVLALFLFAYRKQSSYITKRIEDSI